jgi:hypothetical protein
MKVRKGKFARLFSWYPADSLIRPGLMDVIIPCKQPPPSLPVEGVICIQCVPDKFFFLLFSLMRQQLRLRANLRAELIVVRAIGGAVGTGVLAGFKRWSVLTWWWLSQWERAWGAGKDGIAYRCAVLFQPVNDLSDWYKSKSLWIAFKQQTDDYSLVLDGIEVGDLVVDSYLRFRPSPRFDAHDPFVRHIIWQAIRDIRQATGYFSKIKPMFYLSSYSSYIEHGVTVRVALQHGVPVYTFGDLARFGKRLSLEDVYHTIDYSQFRVDFENLDRHEERLEEAQVQLEVRLGGGIDAGTSYMLQSAYGGAQAALPPDFNGSVVIFLHDFYDSYNAYPDLIFCDFWRWICFTIEVLQAGNIKFYLKPHPNQIDLSNAVMADLRSQYPGAQWLPAGMNNAHLVREGMICGVTAYGTVAHELAYMGVPTIGYGRHPHHSFEFCRTAKTCDEYKAMLKSPDVLPVDKKEMRRQALMFYYMRNLYGSAEDIALRQAFAQLWRICNVENGEDVDVLSALKGLSEQPAFKKYISGLATR